LKVESAGDGKRRRQRAGGFGTSQDAAKRTLEVYKMAQADANVLSRETVTAFLNRRLPAKRVALKRTTAHEYGRAA
jgi:hypothetical protein